MRLDAWDVMILLGFAGLTGGLWWVMPPLSLIVAGVLLLAAGLAGARAKPDKPAASDRAAERG